MKKQIKSHFPKELKSYFFLIIAGITTLLVIDFFLIISDFSQHTFKHLNSNYPWLTFIITPLGFMLIIAIAKKKCHFVQSSGIPQVIAAMDSRNKKIREKLLSFRITLGKVFFIFMAILCGAPIGIEGPSIHIGASIFYGFNRFIKFKRKLMLHSLMVIGGSAGLIVAFNAPLAGVMFAFEELGRNLKRQAFLLIGLMSLLVYFMATLYRGNNFYLGNYVEVTFDLLGTWQLIPIAILAGLLGGIFSKATIFLINKLSVHKIQKILLIAFSLGFIVAIFNFISNGLIAGSGHMEVKQLLNSESLGWGFVVTKYFATLSSLISTIPGGLFMPTISIGAGLGSELSSFYNLNPQIIIILTMVTYLSGTIRAPITSTLVILEMTNTLHLLAPALILAFVANFISQRIQKEPLYEAIAGNYLKQN
jgi:H+/Cl- antiporter ClcA